MPPRVLYFDLGKVLVEFSHEIMCRQMAEVAGITFEAVREALFGGVENLAAIFLYETGHLSTDQFFDHFCEVTGSSPDRNRLAEAVCDIFRPIDPMFALVGRLADAGNRLAILSNTNPLQWDYLRDGRHPVLEVGGAESPFAWAIVSFEAGSMKPDRHIYETAIERAGVPPADVFFSDDRLENVAGAKAVGIDAVQFVDAEQLAVELQSRNVPGA